MNLRSAARGFLALLLSAQALWANDDWRVTYSSSNVCALRGSTVNIRCTYEYPDNVQYHPNTVKTLWFTKADNNQPVDLLSDTDYRDRVQYSCGKIRCSDCRCSGACRLRITDLRQSDSGVYKFRFTTPQPGGEYTGEPGVTLTVTDSDLQVKFPSTTYPTATWLQCHSRCGLTGNPPYIWLRNGHQVRQGVDHWVYSQSEDSYSCAVKGYEHLRSPSVYAPKTPSLTVSPSCEIGEGSSVTLNCSSDANPAAQYSWFKVNRYSSSRVMNQGPQLNFRSIQSSDSGQYLCEAKNELGKMSDSISINVKSRWANDDWRVTYSSSNVCTLRRSTVNISCTYEYPENVQYHPNTVKTLWFTKADNYQPVDLLSDTDYRGRVEYSCGEIRCSDCRCSGACSLRITDLRQSDSGVYKFRFTTPQPRGEYTGDPGATFTVTDLQVKCFPSTTDPTRTRLQCHSGCGLTGDPPYIWFKNGHKVGQGVNHWISSQSGDSYSCVVEGYEDLNSPSVYAPKTPSVTLSPSGEIEEGSSVTLSCSTDANPAANYTWFKEHEDLGQSGQNYTITNITSTLGGNYYCQAQNAIGRSNSTFLLIKVPSSSQTAIVAITTSGVLLAAIFLLVFLWMRRKMASRKACGHGGRPDTMEEPLPLPVYGNVSALTNHLAPAAKREPIEAQDELNYASIQISCSKKQEVPVCSVGQSDRADAVFYSVLNIKRPNTVPEGHERKEIEETSEMYSTVKKNRERV